MQTKTIHRWLAMLLCVVMLIGILMPAVQAANTETTDLIRSILPSEGIGNWDDWEYESSNVILVDEDGNPTSETEACDETPGDTEAILFSSADSKLMLAAEPKASVRSVNESSKTVYLGRYGWAQYPGGTYVTQYYPIWVAPDANGDYHEGDMDWSRFAYCACPSMPGVNAGFHTGDIERLSADNDIAGATLNVFKAVMITSPYGPWGGVFHQDFWKWAEDLETDKGETYSIIHALLGYLYDPGSVGTTYNWSQTMIDHILGSGGMLERIIQWAQDNADVCNLVTVYRIKGNGDYQDIVWPEYEPLSSVTLTKSSANPSLTEGNSDYSLAGAVYDVFKDAGLTKSVGSLTTDANGKTDTIKNLVPGTYYAKERTAPKGFMLNSEVISVSVASGETGVFQAKDNPSLKNGSGNLVKKSADPSITSGNEAYSLAGAEYTVYSDKTCKTAVGKLTTDATGSSNVLELDEGTYYVQETKAPAGFEKDTSVYTMEIKSGKTTTLSVEDHYIPGYVDLQKVSSEPETTNGNDDYSLAGAVYTVYSDKSCTKSVGTLTTKADGSSEKLTLPAGTYYAKETKAPAGFKLNTEVYTASVKVGETTTIQATDSPDSGSVSLIKTSTAADAVNGNSNYSLAGAEYTVYSDKACKTEVGKLTTDADGNTDSLSVSYGTYYAKETKAPAGYKLDNSVLGPVTVDSTNLSGKFSASDAPEQGKVNLLKKSGDPDITTGNNNYSLSGAEYTVYSDKDCKNAVGKLTTDASGNTESLTVYFGTYYAKETKAPTGYKLDDSVLGPVTVSANNTTGTFQASDTPDSGTVSLVKVSSAASDVEGNSNYTLEGAVFTVYSDKDCKNEVGKLTTKADGKSGSLKVPYGSYYAKETKAPAGYKLDSSVLGPVTVDTKTPNAVFNATDVPEQGSVKLVKKSSNPDITTGNSNYSLAGAEFAVYSDKECKNEIGKLTTDADGNTKSITVYYGTYYAKETKAPKGYEADSSVLGPVTVNAKNTTGVFNASDVPSMGKLTLTKTSANPDVSSSLTCYSLKGAVYTVYTDKNCEKKIATLKVGEDGTSNTVELPLGDYYIKETTAPTGYKSDPNVYTATITANKTSKVDVADVPLMGIIDLAVQKVDAETKEPVAQGDATLEGAEYTVKFFDGQYKTAAAAEKSESLQRTWVFKTDHNGEIHFSANYFVSGDEFYVNENGVIALPLGTVTIQETTVPANGSYKIDPTVYVRNITADGDTISSFTAAESPDQVIKGRILIVKHTDTGVTKIETPEEGAVFEVYLASAGSYNAAKETERDKLTIDKDGFAETKDLPYGTYTVHQVSGWEGSSVIADFPSEISLDGQVKSHIINNARFYAYLKIVKTDSVTGETVPQADVGFQIYDPNGNLITWLNYDTWYSDSDGIVVLPCELEYGTGYSAVEVSAPTGYILASEPFKFDVLPENAEKIENLNVITMQAKNTPTQVDLLKVDPDGTAVAGAQLQLLDKTGAVVDEWVSADEAHRIYQLPIGENYTLHEAAPPEGFLPADDVPFTVGDTDQVQLIRMEDERIPVLHTTATVDGDHVAKPAGEIKLVDTVTYENLIPGKTYTLAGALMDKVIGEAIVDANGEVITAETEFVPEGSNGSVDVIFTIEDADILLGKTTVVFETIYKEDRELAVHADLTDDDQSMYWPGIGTTATINEEHEVIADELLTLVDVVEYKGLQPGLEYKVTGTLMDKATGEALLFEDEEITAETTFTPSDANGAAEVVFEFDSSILTEDTTLVAFETLFYGEKELAVHADIEDVGQTVVIKVPAMHTTASVDGKKEVNKAEKIAIDDTVTYTNLVVGKEYCIKGILMDKATGEKFLDNGKEVAAETTFTPEQPDGEVTLTFEFNGSSITKDTSIVVFETLYQDEREVLVHADIEDEDQTVTINVPVVPQTGDSSHLPLWLGLGAVALGGILAVMIVIIRRRAEGDDDE